MKFKWTKIKQETFEENNRIVACNVLSAYTDLNEEFKSQTNAIDLKIEVVIIQEGKQLALYSRKLTYYQMRYTVT